jgi:predicted YcjX-like family ATPase
MLLNPSGLATELLQLGGTVRIGVTGLARAGKTALMTSIAANLLALSAGRPALPAFSDRLRGRRLRVSIAPAAASNVPQFDVASHLAALVADPPRWPGRTMTVSRLALDLEFPREGLLASFGPRVWRLEFLDYPGEWLLDLPLLTQDFAGWSETTLRRLEAPETAGIAQDFLGFARGLPAAAVADEALALTGHRLYTNTLRRLRDEAGLSFLQPGRFLMPPPGEAPPWTLFFPMVGRGALASLMQDRYKAYVDAVRRDLMSPLFGDLDRLVVLADVLSALHQGKSAFADAQTALASAAGALRWGRSWTDWLAAFARLELPSRSIERVAFVATKADHVAARQRGNLAALMRRLTSVPEGSATSAAFAVASVRCTEDVVETLAGRPVSAVRGRILGEPRPARSYPGEVPDTPPDELFWQHRFLALPDFEPLRPPEEGRGGVPQVGLDALLAFLLADIF